MDPWKAVCELPAVLRENDNVISSLVELAAIPVEFDLVQPRVSGRWLDAQGRLSRDDERRGTQHRLEYTTIRFWREGHAAALPPGSTRFSLSSESGNNGEKRCRNGYGWSKDMRLPRSWAASWVCRCGLPIWQPR